MLDPLERRWRRATEHRRFNSVKISIDSNEPLEDVIRVVGAAYDVNLTVAAPTEVTKGKPAKSDRAGGRSRRPRQGTEATRKGSNGRSKSPKNRATVSNAELRSWARENGQTVSDRGRVPAAVIAAYRQAH
jgi:hypothetical protein